jgi:general secretion pathway protein N
VRSLLVVAAAACLLAAAVAVEAPATLVDRQLDALTGGRLRVADAAGTIWNGSGALILLPYGARVPVLWHLDALPLLRSRLSGTLGRDPNESPQATFATFDLGFDDFALRRFAFAFPAEALLRATEAPAAIAAAAGGTVDVRVDAFAMRRGVFEGGFIARWQGASLPGPPPEARVALGDVRLEGVGNGGEIKGALSNVGGDIEITGTLTVAATGAARVDARLKPRAGVDAERSNAISAALSMFGSVDDSGGYRVVWQAPGR